MKTIRNIKDALQVLVMSMFDPAASSIWTWFCIIIEGIAIILLSMKVYG